MGQSKEPALRMKVIEDRQQGLSYTTLKSKYGLSYNTVRSICKRYEQEGAAGLLARYGNCGRTVDALAERNFRLVRLVAHCHPSWGVPYILTRISRDYPQLCLQSERHYQRRLGRHKQTLPQARLPKRVVGDQARQPHDTWQIDAKERIDLLDKEAHQACFLNVTDEKTGALLAAKAFPPRAH